MGSWDCGVFTHREIAQRLMDTFTGLKLKELAWFENPREKTLKNGKPRARRAKWLPDREVDLVYISSDRYLDARNPSPAETDFFTVTRMDAWGVSTWFMCTPERFGVTVGCRCAGLYFLWNRCPYSRRKYLLPGTESPR